MFDVCAHSRLPTAAILALGLLEKKTEEEEYDEQFGVGGDNTY